MAERLLSQDEVNRIVGARLSRERERLARDFENRFKSCMAAIHLMLYQEMCALRRENEAESRDTILSEGPDMGFKTPLVSPSPAAADQRRR